MLHTTEIPPTEIFLPTPPAMAPISTTEEFESLEVSSTIEEGGSIKGPVSLVSFIPVVNESVVLLSIPVVTEVVTVVAEEVVPVVAEEGPVVRSPVVPVVAGPVVAAVVDVVEPVVTIPVVTGPVVTGPVVAGAVVAGAVVAGPVVAGTKK